MPDVKFRVRGHALSRFCERILGPDKTDAAKLCRESFVRAVRPYPSEVNAVLYWLSRGNRLAVTRPWKEADLTTRVFVDRSLAAAFLTDVTNDVWVVRTVTNLTTAKEAYKTKPKGPDNGG